MTYKRTSFKDEMRIYVLRMGKDRQEQLEAHGLVDIAVYTISDTKVGGRTLISVQSQESRIWQLPPPLEHSDSLILF